jgi:hypothetical protein
MIPEYLGVATCHDELIGVLRERQLALGISNETLDHITLLSAGHVDKLLGPSRQRGLSRVSLDALLGALALQLIVVEDREQAERMRSRWISKDDRQVRASTRRISKTMLARARSHIVRDLGRSGGKARWRGIGPEVRREIMTAVSWARPSVRKPVEAVRSGDCATAKTSPVP